MKKIKISLLLMFFVIVTVISTGFSYYTNVNKFFVDSRQSDGYGLGLDRDSNDFIINGCGTNTMLDTLTGLCWDRNMNRGGTMAWALDSTYLKPTWNDVSSTYSYPSGKANYPAFAYCEDLVLGGKTDWRLPNVIELSTISIDHYNLNGGTEIENAGFTNSVHTAAYWSYQQSSITSTYALRFEIHDESITSAFWKNSLGYVICVRD